MGDRAVDTDHETVAGVKLEIFRNLLGQPFILVVADAHRFLDLTQKEGSYEQTKFD
ncbi:MAG: hypothetical protein KDE54_11450 [Caldilineaceae bacterium]|nr:hypothetical protein [Caldilineaceae bacterium]MCB0096097.1 hypothetical protein [Caldilineaceae bacterium]